MVVGAKSIASSMLSILFDMVAKNEIANVAHLVQQHCAWCCVLF